MRNTKNIIWGIVLIAVAILLVLNSFTDWNFDIFFDGWWTLFIIVPSISGIFEKKNKTDSISGLIIGIVLLLCAQNVIEWGMIWKLIFPIMIAVAGIKMIISAFRRKKREKIKINIKNEGRKMQSGTAVFCGTDLNFDNVVFDGSNLTAVFGGVECDLRGAIIDRDCVINATCVFGGIDIKAPSNVKVISDTTCIFGGVDVNKSNDNAMYTIYIEGVCLFGGIDID